MADIFCDDGGNDGNDGSTRALAKATLAAALVAAGAGGRVGIKSDSAETQAGAMMLASPGTAGSPTQILSIDWASDTFGSNAIQAGATVSVSGNAAMGFSGYAYSDGVSYRQTGAANNSGADFNFVDTSAWGWVIANGSFSQASTNAGAIYAIGTNGTHAQRLVLINCPLGFGATGQFISVQNGTLEWHNTPSAIAGTVPTTLLVGGGRPGLVKLRGVDLSAAGSGKTLFSIGNLTSFEVENCKLGSSVTLVSGTVLGPGSAFARIVNCDSADTNYNYYSQGYFGTITHESTIVRTGGASDGTTPISRKMVSSANTRFSDPLCLEVIFWNESTSALSLAAEVVSDGVAFTNAELWMEVEALTNSGFPYSSLTSDRASNSLSTPANQTSSSETWTTTGLSSPTKQKLEVSVTPAEKGWIRCRIYLAKASSTVYVCPLITGLGFTSGRQWQAAEAYVLEGAGGGGSSNARGSLLRGLVG